MNMMTNYAKKLGVVLSVLLLLVAAHLPPASAQFADQATYAGTSGGSANAQTITVSNYAAHTVGVRLSFIPGLANTSAAQINVSGLGLVNLVKPTMGGTVALTGGELSTGQLTTITYNGAAYQLVSNLSPAVISAGTGISVGSPCSNMTAPCVVTNSGVVSLGGQVGALTVTGPLAMSGTALTLGGTNTAHGLPVWEGTGNLGNTGAGTLGQVLVSNGASADPSFKSGGWTLLNTLTPSNVANVGDTTSITSSYNEYEITFENVVAATNAVSCEIQVHSGGSFQSTNYVATGVYFAAASTAFGGSTTFYPCSGALQASNLNSGIYGYIRIINPSQTSVSKQILGHMTYFSQASAAGGVFTYGYWNSTGAVDGFQVLFSSGNIASGIIRVYGRN